MPLIYMMVSVLTWSLFPLLSALSVNKLAIFTYIFLTYLVSFIGTYFLLRLLPGYKEIKASMFAKLNKSIVGDIALCGLTVVMSFAALLTAFQQMSKSAATVMYEIWPIIAIYIAPIMVSKKWEKVSIKELAFSFLAFLGVGFLIYPETPHNQQTFFKDLIHNGFVFLPLVGGIFMALSSVFKLRVSHQLKDEKYPLAALLLVQVMINAGVMIIVLPFMFLWPDKVSVYTPATIMAVVFIGLFISTIGTIAYTLAVLQSKKSNIIVLWYLVPVFSVVWLWLAGQSTITPYITLGAIFIITSNLVMTVKADRSLAYTSAVLTMLFGGVYCYFVEGLSMGDYYQAVSVPLVFFTILVAFMMDRLITSDNLEEQRAIEIINFIELHEKEIQHSSEAYINDIFGMVTNNKLTIVEKHYQNIRHAEEPILSEVYNSLDELLTSKIRSTSFAELFLLSLIAALTVACGAIFRPADIMGDSFAIILSLTTMFIFFTVIDLQYERRKFDLERYSKGRRGLSKRITGTNLNEQIVSVVLITVIMGAFLSLLILKRYPGLLS